MSPASRRVRLKICGVTQREDAEAAIAAGADALGFNLFPGSKRGVDLDREGEWIAALPPFVTRVAVLVNAPLAEARRVAAHPAIHCVQFHGDEDAAYCAAFAREGRPFIKALRLGASGVEPELGQFSTRQLLLDADAGAAYGGTGQPIDLARAATLVAAHPGFQFILAGGLRPATVAAAITTVRPYAVDVASGVEREGNARRKDPERMAAFAAAVRAPA